MKPDIRINRVFVIVVITIQCILVGLTLLAFLLPKTVTVYVKEIQSSFQIEAPLEVQHPRVN